MAAIDLTPDDGFAFAKGKGEVLLLACGALAREIVDLIEANRWSGFDIQCLPAIWHNTPEKIVPALREKIRQHRAAYQSIFVLYGDCGTGGMLDRIGGPHCYSFFSGNDAFAAIAEDEFTAFYLTDYLARHFDKLIWEGFGLARHPELRDDYFRHYTKVVYLAQTDDAALDTKAEAAARRLGLAYERRFTGYGDLVVAMERRS
jgi:hypothetical protein